MRKRVLKVTNDMRSMIATAYVSTIHEIDEDEHCERGLCCSDDRISACTQIVGKKFAQALRDWFYYELGCTHHNNELLVQFHLDKIAELDELSLDTDY